MADQDDLASPATLALIARQKNRVEAQSATLKLRVRRGELIRRSAAEAVHFGLGTRIRDQLLTASTRHAALLAARYGVDTAELANALDHIVREMLIVVSDQADP